MSGLPAGLRAYLSAKSLQPLWPALRERLERTGHAISGAVTVDLDDDGADQLSGLLGRPVHARAARVQLAALDAALRSSPAQRGLVAVVAELTGGPLRDRPAERNEAHARREQLWAELDLLLARHGLAGQGWTLPWADWLHRGGVLTRLPADQASQALAIAAGTLARVLDAGQPPAAIAELASGVTGDAHGLDDGAPAAALVLRGLALALDVPPTTSAAERRLLWQRVGVSTDEISGTVITYGLRPPGTDRWSAMMRERAGLGLITHLTVHELRLAGELTRPGEIVHACENPQVLQRLAAAAVARPLACTSGNPAAAGSLLLGRAVVRYHGDFDWPGIAIARRIIGQGARPWRLGSADYREAVERLPAGRRLMLTGRAETTPWDSGLSPAMMAANVAVHEEAIVDLLLADLTGR
ncbi:MAG TPA: TIGR02679 family protein [Streptosporangiaceae bacterium]